jgi:hypothetical protein
MRAIAFTSRHVTADAKRRLRWARVCLITTQRPVIVFPPALHYRSCSRCFIVGDEKILFSTCKVLEKFRSRIGMAAAAPVAAP